MISIPLDHTTCVVILGTMLVGITAGVVGVFALLYKQSLLGDAVSHAALPGIATAFLLTASKNPITLMIGGALSGFVGTLLVWLIHEYTTLKKDAALGIVLSVFFGLGLVLLTVIQKVLFVQQGIINKFLFGDAATLMWVDVRVIGCVSFVILLNVILWWKELILLIFDPLYARSIGYATSWLNIVLLLLLVMTIVIGLQTVGIVLMSTMLIAPAAAARQWTAHVSTMVILAGFFGASASVIGSLMSSMMYKMPTGPSIVVILSCIVLISLCIAPHRGIIWSYYR